MYAQKQVIVRKKKCVKISKIKVWESDHIFAH